MRRLIILSVVAGLLAVGLVAPAAASNRAPAPAGSSIAATAIDDGRFTTLVAALVHVDDELDAGLVDLFLNGSSQYTVFAPTDAAFGAIGVTAENVSTLDAEFVLDVLTYHVTNGRRAANSVVPKVGERSVETLYGAPLKVRPDATILTATGEASIIIPNLSATNGIIHAVDQVLLPYAP
jgi:uncharacterized surface protein with fasciclin (FAS1) repeats